MNADRIYLQAVYGNAVYQSERWAREAAIAKALLDELAQIEAESRFKAVKPDSQATKAVPAKRGRTQRKSQSGEGK